MPTENSVLSLSKSRSDAPDEIQVTPPRPRDRGRSACGVKAGR